ncbi:MAG: histidine--tRNA ligase [Patescibacteria group bacterium]
MPKKSPIQKQVKAEGREEFLAPKGMRDVLPAEWDAWDRVIAVARKFAETYDFGRIETPILEQAELFEKGVGVQTDAIQKEMYVVKTKGGDVLALRPENTAGVVRAYLEHRMSRTSPLQKLWYMGRMFRHERPQAGRLRQFTQIGFEILGGVNDPFYDAQIILISYRILEELKVKSLTLKVNSIGCRVCRPTYIKQLQNYYKNRVKDLCKNCENRLETNPLRLLDCKEEKCVQMKLHAPSLYDKLCSACSLHLSSVLEYLDQLSISYTLDNFLVRGLDYYSKTVFEIGVDGPGSEVGALFGGGRYDYLFEMLGARQNPAVGSAVSIERIVEVLRLQGSFPQQKKEKRVFLVHVGEMAKKKLLNIAEELRRAGILIGEAIGKDSLKSQMKLADKQDARLALILGQKEIFEESIIIRDLKGSAQETIPLSRMIEEVKKRLK